MSGGKKQLNLTTSAGLLITTAKMYSGSKVVVLFITDLVSTERVVFDMEKGSTIGEYPFTLTDGDKTSISGALKNAFG